jgi:hypothetical protein
MTDNIQTASAEQEAKPSQVLETPAQQVQAPASEVSEEWDKDRAMATIKSQREEEKKLKAELKDYARLKAEEEKRIQAQMTETERLQKQADELSQQNAKLQADILRRDVIAETGLPAVFADRLKGRRKKNC